MSLKHSDHTILFFQETLCVVEMLACQERRDEAVGIHSLLLPEVQGG